MELDLHHIESLLEAAEFLKETHPQTAIDLADFALAYYPSLPALRHLHSELKKVSLPSVDTAPALQKASLLLEAVHPELLQNILPLARSHFPEDRTLKEIELRHHILFKTLEKVEVLEQQVELLRNKFNELHKALCYSNTFRTRKINDHAAKVSPIEILDKKASKTIIVFGGMATMPSMPPKEFFGSFADKEVNILFIKDFQQCWYQKGLMGLTNNLKGTVQYLAARIPETTEELICMGTSAGGYAAIRLGVALDANRILSFSPQTKIDTFIYEQFKAVNSRKEEINFNSPDLDLKQFLSASPKKSDIYLYYGEDNEIDTAAADYIHEYVTLCPLPTGLHNIFKYLKSAGLFESFIANI